jgi:hypothetical protein
VERGCRLRAKAGREHSSRMVRCSDCAWRLVWGRPAWMCVFRVSRAVSVSVKRVGAVLVAVVDDDSFEPPPALAQFVGDAAGEAAGVRAGGLRDLAHDEVGPGVAGVRVDSRDLPDGAA